MLALDRQHRILEKLTVEGKVVVSDLSALYGVSDETIRRDLEKLEDEGYAIKNYGGAVLNEAVGNDTPMNIRNKKNTVAKQKIAKIASLLIKSGDHISLDPSSTALFIAKSLPQSKRLHILTNSIDILMELSETPAFEITATAGNVLSGYMALVGPRAETSIRSFYSDKAFVSCRALNYKFGMMDSQESLACTRTAIIDSAKKTYLAVDHTKFGKSSYAKTAPVKRFAGIITDEKPSDEWLRLFKDNGVECYYPDNLPHE